MALHKELVTTNLHNLHAFSYDDAAEREAVTTMTSSDIGKVARQEDDGSFWILISNSTLQWAQISNPWVRANFDATAGKTVAASPYTLGPKIPDNAYIVRAFYIVETTFQSATDAATIAIGVGTDDTTGIVNTTAISAGGNVWDAGAHDAVPDGTAANFTTISTAARNIVLTLAAENLTAGELNLYFQYIVSD